MWAFSRDVVNQYCTDATFGPQIWYLQHIIHECNTQTGKTYHIKNEQLVRSTKWMDVLLTQQAYLVT